MYKSSTLAYTIELLNLKALFITNKFIQGVPKVTFGVIFFIILVFMFLRLALRIVSNNIFNCHKLHQYPQND